MAPSQRQRNGHREAARGATSRCRQDQGTGALYLVRAADDDEAKAPLLGLLLALCDSRHGCASLLRGGAGAEAAARCDDIAFLAAAAPPESPIRVAARELLARLRSARAVLGGGPAAGVAGSRPAADRALQPLLARAPLRAPDLHALRKVAARANPPAASTAIAKAARPSVDDIFLPVLRRSGGSNAGWDAVCAEEVAVAALSPPRSFSPLGRALAAASLVSSFERVM